jgi:hypothetical protein
MYETVCVCVQGVNFSHIFQRVYCIWEHKNYEIIVQVNLLFVPLFNFLSLTYWVSGFLSEYHHLKKKGYYMLTKFVSHRLLLHIEIGIL